MWIIAWLVLGIIAALMASKLVNQTGKGLFLDIGLGVAGAMAGGFVFQMFGTPGITGFNLWTMLVVVTSAICVLYIYHSILQRRFA